MGTKKRVRAAFWGLAAALAMLVMSLVAVPAVSAGDGHRHRPHVSVWFGLPSVVVEPGSYHTYHYYEPGYRHYRRGHRGYYHHHHGDDSDSDSDHRHHRRRHWDD
jgi:hypothetical protein